MSGLHRKRIKHFQHLQHVHELTFSCLGRRQLLKTPHYRTSFCEELGDACNRCEFRLLAYVVMPEHVHILVWPSHLTSRVERLLADTKRSVSRRIKRDLALADSPLLPELTISNRLEAKKFRFWQAGPGYDRNLTESRTILATIDYIHLNPVRRGLCRAAVDWEWSSARRLLLNGSLDDTPQLSRFDPELMCVAHGGTSVEEHC